MGRVSRGITLGQVQAAERRRVNALLERDRAYRSEERLRAAAEVEIAEGRFVNLSDTVIGPTPEQLAKGEFRTFTPRLPDKTVRTVKAYRRQDLPQVQRMVLSGVIDSRGFRDCRWYRDVFEASGIAGAIPSIDYEREIFTAFHGKVMFTESQMEAQDTLRLVRSQIQERDLALLDQVVLDDVPYSRAFRILGFRTRRNRALGASGAKLVFARIVQQLSDARAAAERER